MKNKEKGKRIPQQSWSPWSYPYLVPYLTLKGEIMSIKMKRGKGNDKVEFIGIKKRVDGSTKGFKLLIGGDVRIKRLYVKGEGWRGKRDMPLMR